MDQVNVYIHLGAEKTGSSSIQDKLLQNRNFLLENGICYLGAQLTWKSKPNLNHQSFFKSYSKKNDQEKDEIAKSLISNWVNYYRSTNTKNFIISWESASPNSPLFKRLVKSPFIKAIPILFIRNQVDWLRSGWKQYGCKIKGCDTIDDWAKYAMKDPFWNDKINWNKRIGDLEKTFGANTVKVLSYDLESQNLEKAFLKIINDNVEKLPQNKTREKAQNKPLRNDLVEITRLSKNILKEPFSEELTNMFQFYLGKEAFIESNETTFDFNQKTKNQIVDFFEKPNTMVAEKHFKKSSSEVFKPKTLDSKSKIEPLKLEGFIATFVELLLAREQKISRLEKKLFLN